VTVADVIKSALRVLGVVSEEQPPSPEQEATGLEAMNGVLAGWATRGVATVSYSAVSDIIDRGAEFTRALKFALAAEMALEYGQVVSTDLARMQQESWIQLYASVEPAPEMKIDNALKTRPRHFDPYTRRGY